MINSTIHVLILVPVFFVLMKERALRRAWAIAKFKSMIVIRAVKLQN
jgi:hypothetical protein